MSEVFTVGQPLFFVPHDHRLVHERAQYTYIITIEKIGRKWLTTSHGLRLHKDTLVADGGEYVSPGRAWITEEAYLTWLAQRQAWDAFQQQVRRWLPSADVTVDHIAEARRLLRLPEREGLR